VVYHYSVKIYVLSEVKKIQPNLFYVTSQENIEIGLHKTSDHLIQLQSNLSYVTSQGNIEIGSRKTSGHLIQV